MLADRLGHPCQQQANLSAGGFSGLFLARQTDLSVGLPLPPGELRVLRGAAVAGLRSRLLGCPLKVSSPYSVERCGDTNRMIDGCV